MTLFSIGLGIFILAHLFPALLPAQRNVLIGSIGPLPYKGLFALISLAGFVLIIRGWPTADASLVYSSPYWVRHVTYLLMAIALVLLASAYLPAGKIAAAAKHPMVAGVKIWAFAHLLVNGEVRSVLLFGAFLAYAVIARISAKRRQLPTRTAGPIVNDAIAVVVGLGVTGAIVMFAHRYIAGVSLIG